MTSPQHISYSREYLDSFCDQIVVAANKRGYKEATIQMNQFTRDSFAITSSMLDSFMYQNIKFRVVVDKKLQDGLFFSFKGNRK